jgi:hypothetical protein
MRLIPKPIRIEAAFDDREQIRAMFERHAPYPAIAAYLPQVLGFNRQPHLGRSSPLFLCFEGTGPWAGSLS